MVMIEWLNVDDVSVEFEVLFLFGWRVFVDDESGRVYFGNFDMKRMMWE